MFYSGFQYQVAAEHMKLQENFTTITLKYLKLDPI